MRFRYIPRHKACIAHSKCSFLFWCRGKWTHVFSPCVLRLGLRRLLPFAASKSPHSQNALIQRFHRVSLWHRSLRANQGGRRLTRSREASGRRPNRGRPNSENSKAKPIAAHLKSCGIWEKFGRAGEKNSKQISESASELSVRNGHFGNPLRSSNVTGNGIYHLRYVTGNGPCSHLTLQVTVSHS
jgi:hypothetical protein